MTKNTKQIRITLEAGLYLTSVRINLSGNYNINKSETELASDAILKLSSAQIANDIAERVNTHNGNGGNKHD